MPHNRGTRHKPKYVGLVSYRGRTKWVGTHSSIAAYKTAEQQREEVDADDRLRAPTVLEFAGAKVHRCAETEILRRVVEAHHSFPCGVATVRPWSPRLIFRLAASSTVPTMRRT
jgi:hypothetical protein